MPATTSARVLLGAIVLVAAVGVADAAISHDGVSTGAGQYGLVRVADGGGDAITVTLSGRTWDGRTLVERSFELRAASRR